MILDKIPQRITVVLGESQLKYEDLKTLGEGSLITLNTLAGESVEVRVNDVPIALGEIVTVDENFGVRITDLLTLDQQKERLAQGKRIFLTDIKKK